jgi:tetratricopeptide (TPR) repeat protein
LRRSRFVQFRKIRLGIQKEKKMRIALKALICVCLSAAFAFGADNDAQAARDRAEAAYEQGNMQDAIKHWTQAIKIDPNNAVAYYSRGNAYKKLTNFDKAIITIRRLGLIQTMRRLIIIAQSPI